jgi:hypothetical protein
MCLMPQYNAPRIEKGLEMPEEMRPANERIVALNALSASFWEKENQLRETRMADDAIRTIAFRDLASETSRRVSVYSQKSLEQALQDAEVTKKQLISELAQSAARAERVDPLQRVITDIVRSNPNIGAKQLLEELRELQPGPVIDEIDDQWIYFKSPVDSEKGGGTESPKRDETIGKKVISAKALISGLKHRLTRARKKIQQENVVSLTG